jgi:cysteine dioxygenase
MTDNAVANLVEWLHSFESRIDIDVLTAQMTEMSLSVESFRDYIEFSDEHYQRNLVASGEQFYALVMCWKPGQAAAVHDHRGASCGVRVLQGTATETSYRWQDKKLVVNAVRQQIAGDVCGSFDADIHDIRNNASDNLVTLHIYSPCLADINIYNLETGEVSVFTDPLVV